MPRVELKNLSIDDLHSKLESEDNDFYAGDKIVINPTFQRGDEETGVWSKKDKQYFIESLVKSYPTGILTFVKDRTNAAYYQNPWSCLDGGNRLRAIRDFVNEKFPDLDGKNFSELELNEQARFKAKNIPCQWMTVEATDASNTIAQMFTRLNTTAKPLSPGELIKAHGWKGDVDIIEFAKSWIGHPWNSEYTTEHMDIDYLSDEWQTVFCRESQTCLEESRRCDSLAMLCGYIISAIKSEFWLFDKRYDRLENHLNEPLTESNIQVLNEKLILFLDIMKEAYSREVFGSPVKGIPSRSKVAVVWKLICEGNMTAPLASNFKRFYSYVTNDYNLLFGYNAILNEGTNGETTGTKMSKLIEFINDWNDSQN